MSTREIEHAAMLWHVAHVQRMKIGAEKRRLEKAIKADVDRYDFEKQLASASATPTTTERT